MENKKLEEVLGTIKDNLITSFELGMKYKRLQVTKHLLPILRQNEFDESTIAIILRDVKLLEKDTYADVFANDAG